jgi:hypothetical protein
MKIKAGELFRHIETFLLRHIPLPEFRRLGEYSTNQQKLWAKFSAEQRGIFIREEKVLRTFLTGGLCPAIVGRELNRPRGSPASR